MGILEKETVIKAAPKVLPKKPKAVEDNISCDPSKQPVTVQEFCWPNVTEAVATPMEQECFSSVWNFDVDVVNADPSPVPSEAFVIAENSVSCDENRAAFAFPSEDIDDNWCPASYHAPPALVEGIKDETSSTLNSWDNFDLIQFAMEESDIDEVPGSSLFNPAEVSLPPTATTDNFIYSMLNTEETDTTTTLVTARKSSPSGSAYNRRVGRPERQAPLTITELPKKGTHNLTPEQIKAVKYRRMRDLNNEASKKCRKKRKEKLNAKEIELQEQEERNRMLRETKTTSEKKVEEWLRRCRFAGCPQIQLEAVKRRLEAAGV